MQLVQLVLVSAHLSVLTTALDLQPSPETHLAGSSITNEPTKPVILKFSLHKNGTLVRSCYGAHINSVTLRLTNWILPAECLDARNYDVISVKYGYKQNQDAKFELKKIYTRIYPKYDDETKAHNIGIVTLDRHSYMDPQEGYSHTWLPSLHDTLDNKMLGIYEFTSINNYTDGKEEVLLQSIKTKPINSMWCKLFYPLSPIKRYHVCASAWYGKGLSEDDLGTPLLTQDGSTFEVVGLATVIRPWAHYVSFPMEFLSIRPYLRWITLNMK